MAELVQTREPYLHEQAGDLTGYALLRALSALEEAPKALGSPYTLSEATEALPPPGSLGPAGIATGAAKGFGALTPFMLSRLKPILRTSEAMKGMISPQMESRAVRSLGRDVINWLRRNRSTTEIRPSTLSEGPGRFFPSREPMEIAIGQNLPNLPPQSVLTHEVQHLGYFTPEKYGHDLESRLVQPLGLNQPASSPAGQWAGRLGYHDPKYASGELIAYAGDPEVRPGSRMYSYFEEPPVEAMNVAKGLKRDVRPWLRQGYGKLREGLKSKGFSSNLPSLIGETHARSGGSSISQAGENLSGKPGYAVSVVRNAEEVLDHQPSRDEISAYLTKHKATLDANPDLFVGTWADGGMHYLDISQHVSDYETAMKLAKKHSQKAIFDLEKMESIYLEPVETK